MVDERPLVEFLRIGELAIVDGGGERSEGLWYNTRGWGVGGLGGVHLMCHFAMMQTLISFGNESMNRSTLPGWYLLTVVSHRLVRFWAKSPRRRMYSARIEQPKQFKID